MKIINDAPLSRYTSLRAGGLAYKLVEVENGDDLAEIISKHSDDRVWILGFGTNCLISDKGLPGTVILNRAGHVHKLDTAKFKVSSGYNWDGFVGHLISNHLWGLEFTSGVPGGVGAAIVGNIAAYGHQVADTFVEATVLNIKDGSVEVWNKQKLSFDYRSSAFQLPENRDRIILDATFELSTEPLGDLEYDSALKAAEDLGLKPTSLLNRRRIILEARRRADSLFSNPKAGPWTAGSFFKNPLVSGALADAIMKYEEHQVSGTQILHQNLIHGGNETRVSAAHVLLAACFHRGQTWGNVRLDPDHVLKIENTGEATAQEIYDVVQHILTTVKEELGIVLEPEVRFLGEF